MSLKRKLAATAVALSAAAVPFVGTAPAMAVSDPNLAYFNTAVDLSNLVELVASKPLCATTLEQGIARATIGPPKVVSAYPVLVVDFRPTNTYVVTVEGLTVGFINCTLT